MIVLDASAAIELFLNLPLAAEVRRLIADPEVALHAPHLLSIEFLQVMRRRVAGGLTDAASAQTAISSLADLDLTFHDHLLVAGRVWELSDNLTAYDAAYVALAELLDADLITADARLANAPGNRARVVLLGQG